MRCNHDNENLTRNRSKKQKNVYPAQKHIYVKKNNHYYNIVRSLQDYL